METGSGARAHTRPDRGGQQPGQQLGEQQLSDRLWTVPNVLSVLRLIGVPVFVWLIAERELAWAGLVLVLSGVTDYLDGRIARRFHLESRLGQLLDPIADRLYIATTLVGLAWVDVIPWWFVLLLVARDAAIAAMYPLVRSRRLPIPKVDFVGKAATFNLLGAFPLLIFGHVEGWWTTASLATGWALAWWGAALYWVAGGIYAWQVRHMAGQRAALDARVGPA